MYKLLLILLCLAPGLVMAQDENDPTRWTPDDIIHTESMREVAFSPDKQMLVWTKRRGLKEKDKFVSDIYLTRLDVRKDGKFLTIPLTQSEESDYSPLFSRDGEKIYFLSSRDEGKKLWALSIYGGEAREVHEFENGISDIKWLSDSSLAFTAHDGKTLYEQQMEKKKDNTIVVEDSVHWTTKKVYVFDLKDQSIKRLSENRYPVGRYAVSRDGRWMITALQMSPHYPADAQPKTQYFLYDLQNDEKTRILEGLQTPRSFAFSPDHQGFYFTAELSSDPDWNGAGISELYYFDLSDQDYQKLNLDHEWGLGGSIALTADGVIAHLANGATRQLAHYRKEGDTWQKQMLQIGEGMEEHIGSFTLSEDGTHIVFDYSTAGRLPEFYLSELETRRKQLSFAELQEVVSLNDKLKKKPKARYEVLRWQGYNDDAVTGLLYYPEDYEEGKKYPLVLSIHGGPSGVDLDLWRERWSTYPNIFSQRGAFVLKPNYHGSSNHGLDFVESIKGNYYEPELEDITAAIDLLAERGMVDKDQLGVMGWSNGAILTTMLTVRYPDMFKAAAPGAGDVNWTSDYGTCRFGVSFDQSYFGGAPWDDSNGKFFNENYIIKSPLFELEKVKTPTIIFHGSEDRAVPRDQGWEYYRALQQVDRAPVRFLWFPGQPHGLQKLTHQKRKMEEEIAWFDRYLFENYEPDNEAFKEDSPLARLLQKKKASQAGNLYGVQHEGKLIPQVEALDEDSISVGIFEVTNAQYQAYKPEHSFDPTKANFPVYGLKLKEAQAYVDWLKELSGEDYRLPTKREARKWHKMALKKAGQENTLNYWSGYDITPEEVDMLQEKVQEAGEALIKEVGSHKALKVGKARLYDLGGNVSEMSAEGSSYGFSAYDYADENQKRPTAEAYRGFRLVKE
jgi:dipeptidyl aminopeptidase/acylaminoacyl peptidase